MFKTLGRDPSPKITGVKGGMGQAYLSELFRSKNPRFTEIFSNQSSPEQWKSWVYWKDFGQDLHEIEFDSKGKLNDYIQTASLQRGFFVNKRLRELLDVAHLPNHHFFDITFLKNNTIVDGYWWFCYDVDTGETTVDFSQSKFQASRYSSHHRRFFEINSYQDYLQVFYDTGEALKATELVFNSNFDQDLDIWSMQFLSNETYISPHLIKSLKSQSIIGYRIDYPITYLTF